MPDLPGLWSLTPFGAVLGLMVLQYWLLSTARLYTRKQHEESLELERLRGNEWKETSEKWEAMAAKQSSAIQVLSEEFKIVGDFFKKTPVEREPRSDRE